MWYGAECDDLDCIENFETLINAISNGLTNPLNKRIIFPAELVSKPTLPSGFITL